MQTQHVMKNTTFRKAFRHYLGGKEKRGKKRKWFFFSRKIWQTMTCSYDMSCFGSARSSKERVNAAKKSRSDTSTSVSTPANTHTSSAKNFFLKQQKKKKKNKWIMNVKCKLLCKTAPLEFNFLGAHVCGLKEWGKNVCRSYFSWGS